MPGVHVVTDSACDLTDELAGDAGITVVPLTIRFGDEELIDRRDLSPTEFWARCKASPTLPETSAPSPGAFQRAYEAAATAGAAGVLCLNLSSGVSATYQSARAGAEAMGEAIPVRVVDTLSLTMGEGLMCLAAAEAAAGGAELDELVALMQTLIGRTHVYGVVDTLDHLQRGGRIGGARALLGSLLSIKPVVQVKGGVVEEESKQRTRARSLEYLAAKVKDDAPLDRLAVCNGAAEDIDDFLAMLEGVETAHPMVLTELGPVVGTHSGPGTIGACYQVAPR